MLPERIGSAQLAEMAAQGASHRACVPASQMPRLAALLAKRGAKDELLLQAEFRQGAEGFPEIRLRITGTIHPLCQRCLEPVAWGAAIDVELTVIANEEQAGALADPFDSVMLDEGELHLMAAAEDELLAALPLAPKHEDVASCAIEAGTAAAQRANRPFAGLSALLSRRGTAD